MDTVMLIFALCCCFCGLFTFFVLPETKGRNMEEIAKSIGKNTNCDNSMEMK
jgi:Sugar (and other) transporter